MTTISAVTQETRGAHAATARLRRPVRDRVAGAPISWGVCEVPGWGYQLDAETGARRRCGSWGWRPPSSARPASSRPTRAARADQLVSYGLGAVGGFLPVLLHDPDHDPLPEVERFIDACLATGAEVVVLAAFTGVEGYDDAPGAR